MSRTLDASDMTSHDWMRRASEYEGESGVVQALLAVASTISHRPAYCPLPPGYRVVYANGEDLFTEAVVAFATDAYYVDKAVALSPTEGVSTVADNAVWYLAPGETLADAEEDIRASMSPRA